MLFSENRMHEGIYVRKIPRLCANLSRIEHIYTELVVEECLCEFFSLVLMGYCDRNYHAYCIMQTKLIADDW